MATSTDASHPVGTAPGIAVVRTRPAARVILLAGASGSGKTRVTRRAGVPTLALDDFYRDGDDPWLRAQLDGRRVDWDDPLSWDRPAALAAIRGLCTEREADVPVYDIPTSRRTGTVRMALGDSPAFVAEGIFAAELAPELGRELLLADAVFLRTSRTATFARRLARDLVEGRKSPSVLIRRGLHLARSEPALVTAWAGAGLRPIGKPDAQTRLSAIGHDRTVPPARLHPTLDFVAVLRESARFVESSLATADLDAPVSGCPGWSVLDLVEHLGGVHRWATVAVTESRDGGVDADAPRERGPLTNWFADGTAALLDALTTADAADPCWTFDRDNRTVSFWIRRQAHETAMHAWDLASAAGAVRHLDRDVAADGVEEVVSFFTPRQVRLRRIPPLPYRVTLRATDADRTWVLGPDDAPEVTVAGSAQALLLLLWRRTGTEDARLQVQGAERLTDLLATGFAP